MRYEAFIIDQGRPKAGPAWLVKPNSRHMRPNLNLTATQTLVLK